MRNIIKILKSEWVSPNKVNMDILIVKPIKEITVNVRLDGDSQTSQYGTR